MRSDYLPGIVLKARSLDSLPQYLLIQTNDKELVPATQAVMRGHRRDALMAQIYHPTSTQLPRDLKASDFQSH